MRSHNEDVGERERNQGGVENPEASAHKGLTVAVGLALTSLTKEGRLKKKATRGRCRALRPRRPLSQGTLEKSLPPADA